MSRSLVLLAVLVLVAGAAGCANLPGGTDLGKVAKDFEMKNVTTGDGTFENYTATGFHSSREVGLAFGLPGFGKFMEVYPKQDNAAQVCHIAWAARETGADAMINVQPPEEMYTGLPFIFFGLYVDRTHGTGIKTK